MDELPSVFDLLWDVKTMEQVERISRFEGDCSAASPEDLVELFLQEGMAVPDCLSGFSSTPKTELKKSQERIKELEDSLAAAKREAENLAMFLWKKYYKEDSPRFELCDSVAGVISQIDNMATGLVKRPTAQSLAAIQREAIEKCIDSLYGQYVDIGGIYQNPTLEAIKEYAEQLTDNT